LIAEHCVDPTGKAEPIYDGPVNIEAYASQKIRILWILKEPRDEEGQRGGGWRILSNLRKDMVEIGKNRTFKPMIYVSYAILNGFLEWEEMDDINQVPEMALVLEKTALINVKKLPGLSRTPPAVLSHAYTKNKGILIQQIKAYGPNVIIGGNTLQYFVSDLQLGRLKRQANGEIETSVSGGRVFINAYHPSQPPISRERYVNTIVSAVKRWWQAKQKM
jgi:hypothetical protein